MTQQPAPASDTPHASLAAVLRENAVFGSVGSTISWDEQTQLPKAATDLRAGRWRRHVKRRLSGNAASPNADQKLYAQRSQSETAHSMMKRNLSSALRARTPARQKKEMMLRVLVRNITLLCDELEG